MTIIEILPIITVVQRAPDRIADALASNTLADVVAAWVQPVSLLG